MSDPSGEFTSGGVTKVTSLLPPASTLQGIIFYLLSDNGGYLKGYYTIIDDGAGGYEWNKLDGAGRGKVFISSIVPTPGQTSKAVDYNTTSSGGFVIEEATGNTDLITVGIRAIGDSEYMPQVTVVVRDDLDAIVDSAVVDFSSGPDSGGPEFEATVELDVGASSGAPYDVKIEANHIDGAADFADYHVVFGPVITQLTFVSEFEATGAGHTNEYPLTGWGSQQIEVKQNDPVWVHVVADPSAPAMTGLSIYGNSSDIITSEDNYSFASTYDTYVQISVQNTSNGQAARGITARAQKADGVFGEDFDSTSSTNGELTQLLHNNVTPTISIGALDYPGAQTALKGSEQVVIPVTFTNADNVRIPEAELIGTSLALGSVPTSPIGNLTATRNSGAGSVGTLEGTNNLRIQCFRSANGRVSAWSNIQVWIQDDLPVLNVVEPGRLISSPAGYDTGITISVTNQNVGSVAQAQPILTPDVGVMQGSFSGSGSSFSQDIRITDADVKGTYTWQAISVTNRAGQVATTITGDDTYVIGGFVERQINFTPAFSNEHPIGAQVQDTAKLVVEDLAETLFSYQANLDNNQFTFTITDGAGTPDPDGTHLWITDQNWVNSNATGTAYVTIRENA
jgi:hypothetical protein